MPRFRLRWYAAAAATAAALTACGAGASPGGAPASATTSASGDSWARVVSAARGQTVSLWMWGGDSQGNAYVDNVLAPAAATAGVTLKRVPIADTKDALTRILAEKQAGREDGAVDLVWVNGDNFATGKQAGVWRCGWSGELPNSRYLNPQDPLLTADFGTRVEGCESPWHKAQFSVVFDAARVSEPPTTLAGLLDWARSHPGRFTYPAPPDFTGSVFVRQALYSVSGGYAKVPSQYAAEAYDRLAPSLWQQLTTLAPSLWREGSTYPRDSVALDKLFADGEVDFTMTYGPATLTKLVADGTFPATTRVLPLQEGTVGNASFLAIPVTSGHPDAAMVVANLALDPQQQAAKADPRVWGQFTVLDLTRLPADEKARFAALPASPVVPAYEVLSRNANPELSATWVPKLDAGWRGHVLAAP